MTRGSTGAQLSQEVRSGAIRHVAALESTSMSKRADVLGMPVLLSPTPPLATEGGGGGADLGCRWHPHRLSIVDLRLGWSLRSL
jgi:hypothetical protein